MALHTKIPLSAFLVLLFCTCLQAQSTHRALRQGDENYDRGDYAKAQSKYQEANNQMGLFNAGNAAMQQNNLAEAARLYDAAVEKSTSPGAKADALYNLGNALLQQKKYQEAVKAYENSLRLAPNRPDAQKNLQIAKRLMQTPPPTPPPPPPTPPPSIKPRQYYVDRALAARRQEIPPVNISPETARQMLLKAVLPEEQQNARAYRELSPANRPSRLKKDW